MYYFVLTGLHLAHLVVGLGVLGGLWTLARQPQPTPTHLVFFLSSSRAGRASGTWSTCSGSSSFRSSSWCDDMASLMRTNASLAWLVLVGLTVLSWTLGTDHGLGATGQTAASLVIITVAVFKIRLVGLYFMELRQAPLTLRGLFEGYCVVLLSLLFGIYLLA